MPQRGSENRACMVGRSKAFTLIEIMISIALLAIFLAISLNKASLHWLNRESDYRFALRNARHQMAALRTADFASLPPQSLVVGPDGWVQLGHNDLVPDSVKILGSQTPPKQVDSEHGRVQLEAPVGSRVVVDYSYYLPDQGEAHTVPFTAPYRIPLLNVPAIRILQVRVASAETLKPLPSSAYKIDGDQLELGPSLAGKVVEIDYTGQRIRNQLSGSYLSQTLAPSLQPGPNKLLRIQESYGAQGSGRIELTLVKPQ